MVDVRPRFWGRDVRVAMRPRTATIGSFSISNNDDDGLRIAFEITRTNAPDPDQARIRIYGLSAITRAKITALFEIERQFRVFVFAGYRSFSGIEELLFLGDVYKFHHKKDGGFVYVSEIVAGDGTAAFRDGQMNESFVAGVPIDTTRRLVQTALGLNPTADAEAQMAGALASSTITTFDGGFTASGPAHEVLTEVCAAVGVKWWIRDNKIIYVRKDQVTRGEPAIVLNQKTGLISVGEPKELGDLEFMALLNPRIFPGRQIVIQDKFGIPIGHPAYRVDYCRYVGDTHGDPWHVNGIARRPVVL
jgi:hypothetical protein